MQEPPTLFARIRVKFLSFVWKRLDNLAMSSLVLGGAVGAVGESKSPMLSSPSSPITSFTCTILSSNTPRQRQTQNSIFVIYLLPVFFTCFGFTMQMTLSGQLQILRTGSNLEQCEDFLHEQFLQKGLRLVRIENVVIRSSCLHQAVSLSMAL